MFGIIGLILIGIVFFGQFAPQLDGYFPAILLEFPADGNYAT